MYFEIICIEHISSHIILLKSFEINGMVHCWANQFPSKCSQSYVWYTKLLDNLAVKGLVHFRTILRITASFSRGWFKQCTIPTISKIFRQIEWLKMCTIHMIPKHMKISHKQSVLFLDPDRQWILKSWYAIIGIDNWSFIGRFRIDKEILGLLGFRIRIDLVFHSYNQHELILMV